MAIEARYAHTNLTMGLTLAFFAVSVFFVWRSFYGMRIGGRGAAAH